VQTIGSWRGRLFWPVEADWRFSGSKGGAIQRPAQAPTSGRSGAKVAVTSRRSSRFDFQIERAAAPLDQALLARGLRAPLHRPSVATNG
jgi:hypothetical protein